ncbi:MAG: AEC family transporter [Faecousia sp.]
MNLQALIEQLIILFAIIFLGWSAVKIGLLPKNANGTLAALVVNVTNPCMVLSSVMEGQRVLTIGQVWLLLAVAFGMHGFLMLMGLAVRKLLRVPESQQGMYQFMCVFGNLGFLGFPVIKALYGAEALLLASLFVMSFQLLCFTYGVSLFKKGQFRWKTLIRPMLLATVLALVLYLTNARPPEMVHRVVSTIGSITSPAAMLAIGCALAAVPLKKVFTNWRLYFVGLAKLVLAPTAIFLLCRGWMPNEMMLGVTVACSAMPVATNTTLLANLYGGDESLAASGVFLTTLMSMMTMPLMMWLLF